MDGWIDGCQLTLPLPPDYEQFSWGANHEGWVNLPVLLGSKGWWWWWWLFTPPAKVVSKWWTCIGSVGYWGGFGLALGVVTTSSTTEYSQGSLSCICMCIYVYMFEFGYIALRVFDLM
ncbi:hypothetical protein ASPTUDRAFT_26444 [Aspergillus tubingensis CBS 134.48]|uniref:Uncharacterized protein n=1 Tax=Aspergillus tubingensis (strain CBS 134.48) TaxID=767770 RepID=A0A1L9NP38_ASPTC|nr:hypothetical protein ASPTUDRAFT_26444 [Aspergillus tubingensis CBS 134.48]